MDNSSVSSNSSESGFCKYCQVELGSNNTSKVGRKSCLNCNKTRLEQCKLDKEPQQNKISCTRCKRYKDVTEYLKQVKTCIECREHQTNKRKEKKGENTSVNSSNNGNETDNNIIDVVSLFAFIKNKHKDVFNYSLDSVIKEMREVQIEEGTESDTETEESN